MPLGDFLAFEVELTTDHETIDGDGMVYEGRRYRVTPSLAGKSYGAPFGVDAGFGDPLWGDVEIMGGSDVLDFCGAPRASWRVYPRQTHLAEKLHAYTMPRARENTRVKDLPDIALLATTGTFDALDLLAAFERTFTFRATHALPLALPPPPPNWEAPYARMADEEEFPWATLAEVFAAARVFLDPILQRQPGRWQPKPWTW